MTVDRRTGKREHRTIAALPDILAGPAFRGRGGVPPFLVFNNSRVRKARLRAVRVENGTAGGDGGTGGGVSAAVDFLLVNRIDSHTWRVMVKRAKRRRPGSRYRFEGGVEGEIVELFGGEDSGVSANGEFRFLRFDIPVDDPWLDIHGHVPLPPYLGREDEAADGDRYQTVYADRRAGADLGSGASAAAPTAGLHFTEELLGRLEGAGIESAFVTLHVGLGTFLPVRTENVEDHLMHEEAYGIGEETARRINAAKAAGRKIVAVGTTSVRTLESAWRDEGGVAVGEGLTSIFIYPGYRFKAVDALLTNFHTPGSTLLMLTAAFTEAASPKRILECYAEAIREGYRFFSYGDAMLIY